MQTSDAIVLRTVDFSETSLVLSLYTRDLGKIEALAKGGRRLKGPFESALDTLAQIRVTFLQKRGDALDLLTEAKLIRRFHVTRSNLAGLYGGFYVVELVNLLTDRNDADPKIYDLAVRCLARLEQGRYVLRTLIRFEGLLLCRIGQQPSLRHCVECGDEVDATRLPRRRAAFGLLDGGVLCPRCVAGHTQVSFVSAAALQALERLTDPGDTDEHWKREPVSPSVLGEIRGLNNNYFSHLIGRRPRLYDWLKFISKNDNTND